MHCPGCGGTDLVKRGPKSGAQRYCCKGCGRYCTDRAPRFSAEVKAQAVDMYLNNVGIRKIARFTGASPAGVLRWIRKAHAAGEARRAALPAGGPEAVPDIIEMDEIYTFVQKKPAAPWSGPPSADA
jgi:transposase-like protein